MKTRGFGTLRVYEISEVLADQIWSCVITWGNLARDTVGKQLVRSADSIGANIAEGSGRGTYADNRRFVRMARASLYETRHWLRRAYRRQLIEEPAVTNFKLLIDELGPQLNADLSWIGPVSPVPRDAAVTNDQ